MSRLNRPVAVNRDKTLATEKQIAANRANAKRSTGPKTLAGKLRSSRNAYRHGLSGPGPPDLSGSARADLMAHMIVDERASEDQLACAGDLARAQAELLRVRTIRTEQLRMIDLTHSNVEDLRRLAALDRYERYALTKRRRAQRKLRTKM
jgi:hypothetical protein